ncbi:MAG: hypothetical protein HY698_07445 [Deltaproteobacteria bacterium]|nr:hypothetical protein [Deltaproteobacteria bacterium]
MSMALRVGQVLLTCSLGLWFLFDRVYPRLPLSVLVIGEAALLLVGGMATGLAMYGEWKACHAGRGHRLVAACTWAGMAGLGIVLYLAAVFLRVELRP